MKNPFILPYKLWEWRKLCERHLALLSKKSGGFHGRCPFRFFLSLFFFSVLLIFTFQSAFSRDTAKNKEATLHRFMIRVEEGLVDSLEIRGVKKLAWDKDENIRVCAIGLLAWYEGECGDLKSALERLCPFILDKKDAGNLEKALLSAKKDDDYGKILSGIPPVSRWKTDNPELCVCFARLLAAGKRYNAAVDGFNCIGEKFSGVPQSLAAEGAGDMRFQLREWERCIGNYEFSLKVLGWLKGQSEYQNYPDKMIDGLVNRIKRKLDRARLAWDAERYGPGFAAYRDARRADFAKNRALAAVLYSRLKNEYPETVYAEAAGLYGPVVLLNLSLEGESLRSEKYFRELKAKIDCVRRELREYEKTMPVRARETRAKVITEDEKLLDELEKVPDGKDAEKQALKELEDFISACLFGLYRGEALLALANWHLEEKLDFETAFNYYTRCSLWLEEIRKAEKIPDVFRVPDKAASVSAPPSGDKMITGWNQYIVKTPVMPEQIINRNTAPWYLDSLQAKCDKALGFCHYARGESEEALKLAGSVLKYEPLERQFHENGEPNTYRRLTTYYKRGWMYATPEELDLFSGKLRLAVMLGDFYFSQEEWGKCLGIRQAILDGKYGSLNKNQTATMIYRLADVRVWFDEKDDNAIKILQPFLDGEYRGTFIRPTALYGLATLVGKQLRDRKGLEKSILCCEEALKALKGKRCDLADSAGFHMADRYFLGLAEVHKDKSGYGRALALYKEILKNPDTKYRDLSNKRIKQIEEKMEGKK